jgi:hypothetical protein
MADVPSSSSSDHLTDSSDSFLHHFESDSDSDGSGIMSGGIVAPYRFEPAARAVETDAEGADSGDTPDTSQESTAETRTGHTDW